MNNDTRLKNLIKWSEQWVTQANHSLMERESLRKSKAFSQYLDSDTLVKVETRPNVLISQFYTVLVGFHSESSNETDNREAAAHDLINAAITIFEQSNTYISGTEKAVINGFENFLHALRSAVQGQWDSPTTPLTHLCLDESITRHLFFYNGLATIGQLEWNLNRNVKLIKIGSSRRLLISDALAAYKENFPDHSFTTYIDQNKALIGNYSGLWGSRSEGKLEYYMEINRTQAFLIENVCKLLILPDGKIFARLASK